MQAVFSSAVWNLWKVFRDSASFIRIVDKNVTCSVLQNTEEQAHNLVLELLAYKIGKRPTNEFYQGCKLHIRWPLVFYRQQTNATCTNIFLADKLTCKAKMFDWSWGSRCYSKRVLTLRCLAFGNLCMNLLPPVPSHAFIIVVSKVVDMVQSGVDLI